MIPHVSSTDQLNRAMPAAARAGLGTKLADLTAQFNVLRSAVEAIYLQNQFVLTPATLVIKAAEGVVPKSSSAFSALVAGVVQSKSANTDMANLPATALATGKACLYLFYIDSAGTLTTVKTSDEATAAAAIAALPAMTANKVRLGYLVVENATGGNFVGNTTALDATGVTVTYVNEPALPAFAAAAVAELT